MKEFSIFGNKTSTKNNNSANSIFFASVKRQLPNNCTITPSRTQSKLIKKRSAMFLMKICQNLFSELYLAGKKNFMVFSQNRFQLIFNNVPVLFRVRYLLD